MPTTTPSVDVAGELDRARDQLRSIVNPVEFELACEDTANSAAAFGMACRALELLDLATSIAAGMAEPPTADQLAVYDIGRWALVRDFGTGGEPSGRQIATLLRLLEA